MEQQSPGKKGRGSIKKTGYVTGLFLLLILATSVKAQDDPVVRLQKMTLREDTLKKTAPSTSITTSSPLWKVPARKPIPFHPITARDFGRNQIAPNEEVTLPNGSTMPATEYLAKLNEVEAQANKHGYSLRDKEEFVSKTVTPASTLDLKKVAVPQGRLKTENEIQQFMHPVVKSGALTLKPMNEYTPSERQKIESTVITEINNQSEKVITTPVAKAFIVNGALTNSNVLKTIDETTAKDFSFGSASTFQAGVKVSLRRLAKVYSAASKKTEFTITGDANIYGSVLGHSFNAITAHGEGYMPADASKKMYLKAVVSVLGFDILNLDEEHAATASVSGSKNKPFEYEKSISVPIIWGLTVNGGIGVSGSVGYSYSAKLDRADLDVSFQPVTTISGFFELSIGIPVVFSIGVKSDLIFLKGFADLDASFSIFNQNANQIVFKYAYNVSCSFTFLSGDLAFFWKIGCVWGVCLHQGQHNFFSWPGKTISGTIADGSHVYNLYSGLVLASNTN